MKYHFQGLFILVIITVYCFNSSYNNLSLCLSISNAAQHFLSLFNQCLNLSSNSELLLFLRRILLCQLYLRIQMKHFGSRAPYNMFLMSQELLISFYLLNPRLGLRFIYLYLINPSRLYLQHCANQSITYLVGLLSCSTLQKSYGAYGTNSSFLCQVCI